MGNTVEKGQQSQEKRNDDYASKLNRVDEVGNDTVNVDVGSEAELQ